MTQTPRNASLTRWSLALGLAVAGSVVWHLATPKAYIPVAAPAVPSPLPAGPIVEDQATAFAGYAGDAACQACHAAEHGKWRTSHHGLAERPLDATLDQPAFEPPTTFPHASQTTTAAWNNGSATLLALGFEGQTAPWKVERVIGHDPLRQFLVAGAGGRLHAGEACWDPVKKEWFNVYGTEDRKPGEWGHWTGRGMVWNTMCAGCHNTRVRKNYDAATDTFKTAMAHATVSCESCHGPMKPHTEWQMKHPGVKPDPTARKLDRDQMLDTCGMCHARRTEITGDFKPGDKFFDHHQLAIADTTNTFYPDGQILEEDYEFSSFLASRMHHAGVRCVDCHDPHTAKRLLPGNALCLRCHSPGGFPNAPVILPQTHTFHSAESTGSQCVNCHMPQTTYMQRHPRHDHGFTIPDPLMTKQFGIPNACNKCHADKETDWTLAAVEKWYGPRMERRTRSRTTLMDKAKRGDSDAEDGLIALLSGDETPYWKASACLLLERWLVRASVQEALVKALKHEHPLVRNAAVRTLEGAAVERGEIRAAIEPLLLDPVRSVRVAAGWTLRQQLEPASLAGKEVQHMLNYNADQPSGQMQLAQYEMTRNQLPAAIDHMKRAVAWDGGSPPFRHDLAIALSMSGDSTGALKELREAIRLNPNEAEYHFKLALALAESGDASASVASFREAVRVDPAHSRAWYNLGLALNAQGDTPAALQALASGERADPRDAGIPYAAATIFARQGRKPEAQAAIARALAAQPQMPEALQLRALLER